MATTLWSTVPHTVYPPGRPREDDGEDGYPARGRGGEGAPVPSAEAWPRRTGRPTRCTHRRLDGQQTDPGGTEISRTGPQAPALLTH